VHPLMPLHAVIGAVGAAVLLYCLLAGHPKTALFVAWACAYSWGALLVEAASRLPFGLRRWHYRDWDGRYFEFDGRQQRIEEDERGEPWIRLEDALREIKLARPGLRLGALTPFEYRQTEDGVEMLSLAGLERLARVSRAPAAARFLRWYRGEVHAPALRRTERRAGGGAPPP